MNIHPIFVHFPIALFTFYSIAECVRFNVITRQHFWFYVKAIIVLAGLIAALVTAATGDMAEELNVVHQPRQHIEIHSTMADITIIIFLIIALAYLLAWLNRDGAQFFKRLTEEYTSLKAIADKATLFVSSKVIIVAAIIGLIAISITGTLGGAMVYGVNNDPVTKIVAPLFFK